MNIGPHLKRLRSERSLTLKQVSAGTRLTPSLVSQVENGRTLPSIPSLERLLAFYRVGLVEFFAQLECETCLVCRASDVETLSPTAGVRVSLLASKLSRTTLVSARVELDPGAEFAVARLARELNGERFILVEAGTLEASVDGVRHVLRPGDSINFKADVAVSLANPSKRAIRAFMNGMPPLFFAVA